VKVKHKIVIFLRKTQFFQKNLRFKLSNGSLHVNLQKCVTRQIFVTRPKANLLNLAHFGKFGKFGKFGEFGKGILDHFIPKNIFFVRKTIYLKNSPKCRNRTRQTFFRKI
jgi:hypothetical protein